MAVADRVVDLGRQDALVAVVGAVEEDLAAGIGRYRQQAVEARILEARHVLAERLSENDSAHLVERFDPDRYNTNSPVSVNLLFGTPIGPAFDGDGLARNSYVQSVLDKVGLAHDLIEVGAQVARMMIELFTGLRPEHEFFEEFGFISADDLPGFESILKRMEMAGVEKRCAVPQLFCGVPTRSGAATSTGA